MLWLYIDLPTLPVDLCERSAGPTEAIVITNTAGKIILANATAQAAGIRPSQSISTASCLHEKLLIKRKNELNLHSCLQDIAHWVYQYCANIALYPPDGLLIEIESMLRMHGDVSTLYHKLQRGLTEQGFHPRLSVGLSPLSARALSQSNSALCTDNQQTIKQALLQLSLAHCGFLPSITEKLHRMGFNTLHQILAIPRVELAQRLGHELCTYLCRLTGESPDPQDFYTPATGFERNVDLLAEIDNNTGLLFPLNRLLLDLEIFLRHSQQSIDSMTLQLHHRDSCFSEIYIGISASTTQTKEILTLCSLKLESYQLPAPVTSITLIANHLQPYQKQQTDLFQKAGNPAEKQQLLNRFYAKLSEEKVVTLRIEEDHRPEKSYQIETQTNKDRPGDKKQIHPSDHNNKLTRPTWILQAPYPLHGTAVTLISDAERISAGWWDQSINRDYYIARFPNGALGWIFRSNEGNWFLHGWFG
ncbi:MAG: DNA polymerase Y family protein [Hahellaceae bacterium]|jgi:protein ImuB|nr:DNA polymerase Y family protein [Hahellaceae bacterium]MCP5211777.1 DNA polymerase Y family protein [Hahellaceae bacterium]